MKRKFLAIALMAAGLMMTACGNSQKNESAAIEGDSARSEATAAQAEDEDEFEVPERGIDAIRREWAGKPLKVEVKGTLGIKDFALAFCKAYPQCETNRDLEKFLSSPNANKEEYYEEGDFPNTGEMGYQIYNKARNGYIHCMLLSETGRDTYACYWNRKNGHKLFAAFMEECWEHTDMDQCLVVFYDYDPATGNMKPEPALTKKIEERVKSDDYLYYYVTLPEEGKDIEVVAIVSDEPEASSDEMWVLKWNGQTFEWED
jgi:hypothetical protein